MNLNGTSHFARVILVTSDDIVLRRITIRLAGPFDPIVWDPPVSGFALRVPCVRRTGGAPLQHSRLVLLLRAVPAMLRDAHLDDAICWLFTTKTSTKTHNPIADP